MREIPSAGTPLFPAAFAGDFQSPLTASLGSLKRPPIGPCREGVKKAEFLKPISNVSQTTRAFTIRIAQRLRAETTVTLKWIATELHLGTWTHVANRRQNAKGKNESNHPAELDLV